MPALTDDGMRMPGLINPRHEKFARARAQGQSASQAYRTAGYADNDANAARLNGNERVRARIAELQEEAARRTLVTIETLTAELENARASAMEQGRFSAAIAAVMGKAKLHRLDGRAYPDELEPEPELDLRSLSEEELDLMERAFTILERVEMERDGDPGAAAAKERQDGLQDLPQDWPDTASPHAAERPYWDGYDTLSALPRDKK